MSKRTNNMLREKRKHANYKPNRRLDAKSSRGMIYENEELRIRTININAEVERGQSEIKNLKREREQLRREIWTLRDEYDKLENLLRIKGIDPDEFLNSKHGKHDECEDDENVSECSECSCESCCDDECCNENNNAEQPLSMEKSNQNVNDRGETSSSSNVDSSSSSSSTTPHVEENAKRVGKDRMNLNFDHLSVVTEESSEGNSIAQNEDTSIPINDLSAFLHKVDVLSPLSYLQKLSPPLAHFENLPYDKIGDSVDFQGNILPAKPTIITPTKTVEPIKIIKEPTPVVSTSINIVPESSSSSDEKSVKKESRLKHFFSPIRRKKPIPVPPPMPPPSITTQADVFISNVLANNMKIQQSPPFQNVDDNLLQKFESNNNNGESSTTGTISPSFQTGGNLEELLYDIENLSKDIQELQTHCADIPVEKSLLNSQQKQPFRSELNLVLSYPNDDSQQDTMKEETVTSENNLYLQNLPSPFPSATFPSSPITPPINFKPDYQIGFVAERLQDFSHLNFAPLNTTAAIYSSNSSILCTVSAPSTPAFERKCIDKFCSTETNTEIRSTNEKKKSSKRVSIFGANKDYGENDKNTTTTTTTTSTNSTDNIQNDTKEADKKSQPDANSTSNNHSHAHKNHHNHSHLHSHPKRRMSLDNTTQSTTKHKNHRQITDKAHRRESNRSQASFKKRSRSDSTFPYGSHGDNNEAGGTSMSERYSNSLASSRESSTSLSLKSNKRRISINSYGGSKKIPWVN